jgi:hypothetical protein
LVLVLGKNSFHRQSLHHIGSGLNPYEQAISIIGKTMAEFDDDNLIPCFGFGDGSYLINFIGFKNIEFILSNKNYCDIIHGSINA